MLRHANVVANVRSILGYLELGDDERSLALLPFYYVYGLSVLTTTFAVGGAVIPQNYSTNSKTFSDAGTTLMIQQNLTNAYSRRAADVSSWTRELVYNRAAHSLAVHDVCTVRPGVSATWQLHTPVLPVFQGDGSIVAGNLRITPVLPAAPVVQIVDMHALDNQFNAGYRIDISAGIGCEFIVNLTAQ